MTSRKPKELLTKLQMAAYTGGSLANVCWSPDTTDRIADHVSPHVHSFYEIVFIESGSGSHIVNGDRVDVGPGDLFLLGPGSSHDPLRLETAAIWVFIFNSQALDVDSWEGAIHAMKAQPLDTAHSLLRAVHADEKRHLRWHISESDRPMIASLLRRIKDENVGKRHDWEKLIKLTLELLLIELERRRVAERSDKAGMGHPIVALTMDFIDANFRKPIGLRDIAKHVGRSPAYLTNLVTSYTGRPVMAWLIDRRLVEARTLILTSSQSVREVSESVGYLSQSHFSQMFRRKYGDSPTNWRGKLLRNPA